MGCSPSILKRPLLVSAVKPQDSTSSTKPATRDSMRQKLKKTANGKANNMEYSLMVNEEGFVSTGIVAEISDAPVSRLPSPEPRPEPRPVASISVPKDIVEELPNAANLPYPTEAVPADATESQQQSEETTKLDEAQAATRIQAVFRGRQARKGLHGENIGTAATPDMASSKQSSNGPAEPTNSDVKFVDEKATEEVDIDLGDPEVAKAALKIQGAFKGIKARKGTSPATTGTAVDKS